MTKLQTLWLEAIVILRRDCKRSSTPLWFNNMVVHITTYRYRVMSCSQTVSTEAEGGLLLRFDNACIPCQGLSLCELMDPSMSLPFDSTYDDLTGQIHEIGPKVYSNVALSCHVSDSATHMQAVQYYLTFRHVIGIRILVTSGSQLKMWFLCQLLSAVEHSLAEHTSSRPSPAEYFV